VHVRPSRRRTRRGLRVAAAGGRANTAEPGRRVWVRVAGNPDRCSLRSSREQGDSTHGPGVAAASQARPVMAAGLCAAGAHAAELAPVEPGLPPGLGGAGLGASSGPARGPPSRYRRIRELLGTSKVDKPASQLIMMTWDERRCAKEQVVTRECEAHWKRCKLESSRADDRKMRIGLGTSTAPHTGTLSLRLQDSDQWKARRASETRPQP
jgi:hypothetical protein